MLLTRVLSLDDPVEIILDEAGNAYIADMSGDHVIEVLLPDVVTDCNDNGVPDECDLSSGTSLDCNGNGVPDVCDLEEGDPDGNGLVSCGSPVVDLIPDECQVINLTAANSQDSSIPAALEAASPFDQLLTSAERFSTDLLIDFAGKPLTLISRDDIIQPTGGELTLTDDATLIAQSVPFVSYPECVGMFGSLEGMTLNGMVTVTSLDRADLMADQITLGSNGSLWVRSGAGVGIVAEGGGLLEGAARLDASTVVSWSHSLQVTGTFELLGATLDVASLGVGLGGTLSGWGEIIGDLTNDQELIVLADLQVVGDFTNNGATTVQNGVLTVTGSLTDQGGTSGAGPSPQHAPSTALPWSTPAQPSPSAMSGGPHLAVLSDYLVSINASQPILGEGLSINIGGNFDAEIISNVDLDMTTTTLQMVGLSGTTQSFEVMSVDIGSAALGLNPEVPGHYPLGTLSIGPTSTTVNLVDQHDNDGTGQSSSEALYIDDLVIDQGATLNTNGFKIYYNTLINDGIVDNTANLMPIVPVPADFDDDGDVDADDVDAFAICASGPAIHLTYGCEEKDWDHDGDVDQVDFATLQRCIRGKNIPGDPDCSD